MSSVPPSAGRLVKSLTINALVLAGAALGLSGCQTTPTVSPPPPSLRLVDSQPLVLAEDCQASGSFFVEFTVLSDGRTDEVQALQGPACVQEALTAWVRTFRYAPPGEETFTGMEWMMVSGRKGS